MGTVRVPEKSGAHFTKARRRRPPQVVAAGPNGAIEPDHTVALLRSGQSVEQIGGSNYWNESGGGYAVLKFTVVKTGSKPFCRTVTCEHPLS